MSRTLLPVIALLCFASAPSLGDEVYKWVDKNGGVHYGEFPPNNKKSKTVDVPSTPQPAADDEQEAPSPATAESTPPAENKKDKFLEERAKVKEDKEAQEKKKKEFERACNEARSNMEVLQDGSRIRVVDANGKAKFLTDEEKAQRLESEKKNAAKYCKK